MSWPQAWSLVCGWGGDAAAEVFWLIGNSPDPGVAPQLVSFFPPIGLRLWISFVNEFALLQSPQ